MLANANPIATVPASRSVREFVAVLARHNVPYGELDCLGLLLRELHLNKHLAMHFWAAVASLTDKQAADTESIAASIVEASTGHTPSEARAAGPSYATLVDRLERLLAGQDIAPEELPGLTPKVPPPSAAKETVALRANEDFLPIRRTKERDIRVPRAERRPRTRSLAAHESLNPHATGKSESRRIVILPEPQRSAEPQPASPIQQQAPRILESASPAPLSGYAETQRPRRWLIPAVALALLAGVGVLFLAHTDLRGTAERVGTSASVGMQSAVAAWKGGSNIAPAPIVNAVQAPAVTPPANVAASASTPASAAPAAARAVRIRQAPATAAIPSNSSAAAPPVPSVAAPPAPDLSIDSNGVPVPVPEAVMNSHLLVSRVPVVPERLRADGVAGVVRLQANISPQGTVSHLRVLDGPAELHRPALEAVSAWRYRPYIANGEPVNVSTTITVDFSSLQ